VNAGKRFDAVGIGRNCVDYLALVPSLPPPDAKVPMKDFRSAGGGPRTAMTEDSPNTCFFARNLRIYLVTGRSPDPPK
jgi:hypothetical protein